MCNETVSWVTHLIYLQRSSAPAWRTPIQQGAYPARGIYFGNIPDYLNACPLKCLIFAIIVRRLPGTREEQRQ